MAKQTKDNRVTRNEFEDLGKLQLPVLAGPDTPVSLEHQQDQTQALVLDFQRAINFYRQRNPADTRWQQAEVSLTALKNATEALRAGKTEDLIYAKEALTKALPKLTKLTAI